LFIIMTQDYVSVSRLAIEMPLVQNV
jgi:hypothetical protein